MVHRFSVLHWPARTGVGREDYPPGAPRNKPAARRYAPSPATTISVSTTAPPAKRRRRKKRSPSRGGPREVGQDDCIFAGGEGDLSARRDHHAVDDARRPAGTAVGIRPDGRDAAEIALRAHQHRHPAPVLDREIDRERAGPPRVHLRPWVGHRHIGGVSGGGGERRRHEREQSFHRFSPRSASGVNRPRAVPASRAAPRP